MNFATVRARVMIQYAIALHSRSRGQEARPFPPKQPTLSRAVRFETTNLRYRAPFSLFLFLPFLSSLSPSLPLSLSLLPSFPFSLHRWNVTTCRLCELYATARPAIICQRFYAREPSIIQRSRVPKTFLWFTSDVIIFSLSLSLSPFSSVNSVSFMVSSSLFSFGFWDKGYRRWSQRIETSN